MIGKVITADLQTDISTVYDTNKTYIGGNVVQKILNSVPVLGAPLVKWHDVITVSGETILYSRAGSNGRMYGMTTFATGLARVICGTFNTTTGLWTYLGKVIVPAPNVPTTTQALRDFIVDDANTSNIQIIYSTVATGSNATQNGGVLRVYKLALTDFSLSPPTIPFGTADDSKAVYYEQDPANLGILNVAVSGSVLAAVIGHAYKQSTKECWVPNGVVATASGWWVSKFDFNAVPTVIGASSITVTAASPAKVQWTSSGLSNNDVIRFTSGTLPTGLSLNTDYFVRNATGSDFEVSTTFNGTSINTTGSNGSANVVRSFGITTAGWTTTKTAGLPAQTGLTALLTGAIEFVQPVSGHAANNGVDCIFIGCSSGTLLFPTSEVTNGAATLPNILATNLLGTANEVTTPTATHMTWSELFDRYLYVTNVTRIVAKKCINNVIEDIFGIVNNSSIEAVSQTNLITQFGMAAITSIDANQGWVHIVGSTVGQRGILSLNTGASYKTGQSKIITKVLDVGDLLSYVGFASALQNTEKTSGAIYRYRTNLECDFSDTTTGWIDLSSTGLMNLLSATGVTQIQFELRFKMMDPLISNPAQVIELFFAYIPLQWIDPDWLGWVGQTSQDNVSPAYTAYQLDKNLSAAVAMRFIAVNKVTKTIIAMADTDTDFASFDKTSNAGLSWSAMTGANDYPLVKHTSGIRYKWGGAIPVDAVMTWVRKA